MRVVQGKIVSLDPKGREDWKSVGNGLLKLADPMPMYSPLVTARSENGELLIEVCTGPCQFLHLHLACGTGSTSRVRAAGRVSRSL